MEKTCLICNKQFEKPYSCSKKEWEKRKVCSRECFRTYHSKVMMGHPSWTTKEGIRKSRETNLRLYKEGKLKPWNKGKKGVQVSCWKGKKRPELQGENNSNWKENPTDKSTFHQRARKYKKEFCERCLKKDVKTHVHHLNGNIKNNDPENLITVCCSCHSIIHGYYLKLKRDPNGRFVKNRKEVDLNDGNSKLVCNKLG